MSTHLDARATQRLRALHRYVTGVDAGRLDDIAAVLAQAEADPALQRLLDELHEALAEPATDGAVALAALRAEALSAANSTAHALHADGHTNTMADEMVLE